ncbi:MAG: SMC-Scp complex subunit ScpB [Firmicutes bacterium]|jgi:segregation and condensation protein B|uniref:SMC-Scp complex subunit ScpB n=1 Tax=Sulfobacillus benefaciens TaxID=453960 RepID=A0A2T2XBF6_9FIRM|nr:SMC-Scp complex subunit ScpB [Bacillota bacterium]MCL5015763.1 SMC-Scp complex subunit ScpB [Bacillota bacterium]PSR31776.1 MAG: SMC-Scp complex subunit ScpB [Sulfobacillus benefaciens]HBQ94112.1 SMC-Scp complex subunit ScpB [Sulfobacillus sp.]
MDVSYDAGIIRKLEALLFTQADPVSDEQLALWLDTDPARIPELVGKLARQLREGTSGLDVQRVADGYLLTTAADLAEFLDGRLGMQAPEPLSHAAWEVLSVVAYRQPITRLEIETLRQTNSERALETLLSRELIEQVGRKDAPGRPILYGTTRQFLREFGLNTPDQLPPLSGDPTSADHSPS